MKNLLLAGALALATVTPTLAGPVLNDELACVLRQPNGVELVYFFRSVDEGMLAETRFERNGTVTVSPPGKRPPWTFTMNPNGMNVLRSMRTPEFAIYTYNDLKPEGSVMRADAILMKGERLIAQGGCGFRRKAAPAPSAPSRPELGV